MSYTSISSIPLFRQTALVALPLALLLGLAGCQTAAPGTKEAATAVAFPELSGLPAYDYAKSLNPLKALDAAVSDAGNDPAKAAALVTRLTEMLREPATTFAARQAICERLGRLLIEPSGSEVSASHPTLAVLGPWLTDAKLAPLALLALERVPGPAVDQLLQNAAQRTSGPSRAALESCLGRRQTPAAPAPAAPGSVSTLVADLGGTDLARKERALQQLALLPADSVSTAVAAKLGSWDAETQSSALTLLGRLGHKNAAPAALAATKHPAVGVRLAAMNALGRLPGTPAVAQGLLDVAGGTAIEETKAALAALGRLDGPGLNEFLTAGARQGKAAARVLCVRALAARYTLEALPLAYQLLQDSEATVRAAALDLLADIAPYAEQPAVLKWTFQQTDDQEVARGQRALVAITQRAAQPAEGIRVVLTALEQAAPAVQVRQVRMLPRLGDPASLACVKRLAASTDPTVATAAKSALQRWPKPEEKKK